MITKIRNWLLLVFNTVNINVTVNSVTVTCTFKAKTAIRVYPREVMESLALQDNSLKTITVAIIKDMISEFAN